MHALFRRAPPVGHALWQAAGQGPSSVPGALAAAAGVAALLAAAHEGRGQRQQQQQQRPPHGRLPGWRPQAAVTSRCELLQPAARAPPGGDSGGAALEPDHPPLVPEPGKFVLSADCGGTTTRLMLYRVNPDDPIREKEKAPGILLHEEKYPNIAFKSLTDIIQLFLNQDCGVKDAHPMVAVLALAGIVMNNQCRFTNLDWIVSGHEIEVDCKIGRVELINDFVAQGYGMLTLCDAEVLQLNDAAPQHGGTIACIGAGTGLGQCFLVADSTGEYRCFPSEGAHGEFGPRGAGSDDLQIELLKYLKIKFSGWNRISVERVVSGTGICNIYEFLAYRKPLEVDPEVHKQHLAKPRDAGVIAGSAWPGSLAEKTMKVFASCYGAQCGTMALWVQPFGGLYITGGVTKRLAEWLLEEGSFMAAYLDKGRLAPLLEKVPLFVVKGDDMGQRGAHRRAVQLLTEEINAQARVVFDKLDVRGEGVLRIKEFQDAFRTLDDKELAKRLLAELDTDKDGRVDFAEFRRGFTKLPAALLNVSPILHPEEEHEEVMRREELVAPPDRGLDADSQARLAEVLRKYQARSRRKAVNASEDRNAAVFKTVLWKLKATGQRSNKMDWLERDFWINKDGAILYYSVTEGRTLLYCTREDLAEATFEEVTEEASCFPHVFRLHPRPPDGTQLGATEFAAPSRDGMTFWLEQLNALRRGESPLASVPRSIVSSDHEQQ